MLYVAVASSVSVKEKRSEKESRKGQLTAAPTQRERDVKTLPVYIAVSLQSFVQTRSQS